MRNSGLDWLMGRESFPFPGFWFHPTDVELVMYFLMRKVMGRKFHVEVIAEVDVYKFAPWDLPDKSILKGDLKWYFFCPIEKEYLGGVRMNRATEVGHWKVTGNDRHVNYKNALVCSIKTLIFHMGKAPGKRTDWVMHEYRLDNKYLAGRGVAQNEHVLCMIFHEEGLGPRNGAQYRAPFKEEDWNDDEEVDLVEALRSSLLSTPTSVLPNNHSNSLAAGTLQWEDWNDDEEVDFVEAVHSCGLSTPASVLPNNHSNSLAAGTLQWEDWNDDEEVDFVEAVHSCGLSTPASVLPNNHSISVAGTSQWDGTASELCLSENGLYLHELLPAVHSNNDVSVAGTLQWDGTPSESYLSEAGLYLHELLPAVHSNNDVLVAGTSQWDGTPSESCLFETGLYLQDLLPAVLGNNDVSEELHQVLADVSFSTSLVLNEDKKNKNVSHDGSAEGTFPFDVSELYYEALGDMGNTSGLGYDFISLEDLDEPLNCPPEAQPFSVSDLFSKKTEKEKEKKMKINLMFPGLNENTSSAFLSSIVFQALN